MIARPHIGRITAILLLLSLWAVTIDAGATDRVWVDSMIGAVVTAQGWEGDIGGIKYGPYLGQLEIVKGMVRRNDDSATYAAMNRFMDMLMQREHGIASELADWLFDYCNMVTPAKFHDVSRHTQRV